MKKLSVLLFISCLIFSCENNNDTENSIQGKWNVTKVYGGFTQTKNYNIGDVTWFFNMINKTVTIKNNVDVFNTYYAPSFTNNQSGNYPLEIITENNIDYLLVEERKGEIKLVDNELTIDFGVALDDIAYILKR